jgi:transposase InsO family protein
MKLVSQLGGHVASRKLCRWLGLPRSVYYYRPRTGKPGARASEFTLKRDGGIVSNDVVVSQIRSILMQEFCCYGYQVITVELKDLEFIINHKKVYRLMDENNLLLGKVIRTSGKREFVKHRKIVAAHPMEFLCIDIKYVWVEGEKRNYFLLTILDVYSRLAIAQIFQRSIRKMDVINLFRKINNEYGIKGVTVRNDNGSQFIANDVKQFLRSAEAKQEFTHVATPQENSYIEAFHSIVQREVVDRNDFASGYEAKLAFAAHFQWYNHGRRHGMIGKITPQHRFDRFFANLKSSGEAEAGSAGEQPARNILINGDGGVGSNPPVLSQSPSLLTCLQKTQITDPECLNHFGKTVQIIGG